MKPILRHGALLLALSFACRARIQAVPSSASAPSELAFGDVQVGETKTLKLTLSNNSLSDVDLSGADVAAPFSVKAGRVTIPSAGNAVIDVVFAPQAGQLYEEMLTLQLNATETPTLTVHLSGNGLAPAVCGADNCGSGNACCGGACVDTQGSADHCGGCSPCGSGQSCVGGACVNPAPAGCSAATCGSGSACCSDVCVDTQGSVDHCGGCSPCAAGQNCISGACISQPPPQTSCDDLTNPCPGAQKCCTHQCVDVGPSGLCPCSAPGGASTFDVGTLIIPMDACYQRGTDPVTLPADCVTANGSQAGSDAPLKAYGLVFFLLRHQVTVYMGINANKTSIDAVDLSIGSFITHTTPVQRYDWPTSKVVSLPDTTVTSVHYRGAPFIIDASQHDRVLQLFASDPDFAQFRSAANVTVHVAGKSFQTAIAKQISAVPSRVALLVPNNDNTVPILVRYLQSAGLDFPGAGGTPAAPGLIYDQLQQSDFLPDYDHSNLKAGGYKLLWSPHWEGDSSSNTAAQLATIGAFVGAGNDLFAECAAIGTLEGFSSSAYRGYNQPGSSATRFMTSGGMGGNALSVGSSGYGGPFTYSGLASPFAQRGDFSFDGYLGRVTDFGPDPGAGSSYYSDVVRFITAGNTGTDLFTYVDQHAAGKGTVVYLAGHDYSYGGNNDGQAGTTAGSRLVLNTLFSLGENNICQQ